MIAREQFERIAGEFGFLQRADATSINEFRRVASFVRLPARKRLFCEGEHPQTLALLVSGAVRVFKTGRTGREITLYRIGAGETCILSVNAILNRQPIAAAATVEQRVEAAAIPADVLRDWVQRHEVWRQFVFGLISQRLMKVLNLVEDVVFRRMDARVATLLLDRARAQNPLRITHQAIAAELGTSREVISRLLEDLVRAGALRSARGRIEVIEPMRLEVLASQ